MDYSYIGENIRNIKEKISAISDSQDVTLVAAVKYADVDQINYLCNELGIKNIGENRVQQLLEHYDKIDHENVNIHFIGTLQTNKVKYIIDKVCLIQSLDSLKLAEEINRQAKKRNIIMDVLVEINSEREESKSGVLPENVAEFCEKLKIYENIKLKGFMTMGKASSTKEAQNKNFTETFKLILDIWNKKLHNIDSPIISMGMSSSYEEAVACGSNMIRLGRILFNKEN